MSDDIIGKKDNLESVLATQAASSTKLIDLESETHPRIRPLTAEASSSITELTQAAESGAEVTLDDLSRDVTAQPQMQMKIEGGLQISAPEADLVAQGGVRADPDKPPPLSRAPAEEGDEAVPSGRLELCAPEIWPDDPSVPVASVNLWQWTPPGQLPGAIGGSIVAPDLKVPLNPSAIQAFGTLDSSLWVPFDRRKWAPDIKRKLHASAPAAAKKEKKTYKAIVTGNLAECTRPRRVLRITGKGDAVWAIRIAFPPQKYQDEQGNLPIVHAHARIRIHTEAEVPRDQAELSWERYAKHAVLLMMTAGKSPQGKMHKNRASAAHPRVPPWPKGAAPAPVHFGEYQIQGDEDIDPSTGMTYITLYFGVFYQNQISYHDQAHMEQKTYDDLRPLRDPIVDLRDVVVELRQPSPDNRCRWHLGSCSVTLDGQPAQSTPPGVGVYIAGNLQAWTCHGSERVQPTDTVAPQGSLPPHKTTFRTQVDLRLARNESDFFQVVLRPPVQPAATTRYRWRIGNWQLGPAGSGSGTGVVSGAGVPVATIYKMEYVPVSSNGYNPTYQYDGWVGEVLHDLFLKPKTGAPYQETTSFNILVDPADASKKTGALNVPFLFEVARPAGHPFAPTGEYRTTVSLIPESAGPPCLSFSLVVTALPYGLPDHPRLLLDHHVDSASFALARDALEKRKTPVKLEFGGIFDMLSQHAIAPRIANAVTGIWAGQTRDAKATVELAMAGRLDEFRPGYWRDHLWDTGGRQYVSPKSKTPGNLLSNELSADQDLQSLLQARGASGPAGPQLFMLPMSQLSHRLNSDSLLLYYGEPRQSSRYSKVYEPGRDWLHVGNLAVGGAYSLKVSDSRTAGLVADLTRRHVQSVIGEVFKQFPVIQGNPDAGSIVAQLTGEGGLGPKLGVLRRVAAMCQGMKSHSATATVGRMGLQLWHPGYKDCNWWYFSAPAIPFEPHLTSDYDQDSDKHKCIYDNMMVSPRYHPLRPRLFFWRLWKEGYESYLVPWAFVWKGRGKRTGYTAQGQPFTVEAWQYSDPRNLAPLTANSLIFPPRPDDKGETLCPTLRLKVMNRGVQDHSCLTLLSELRDKAPAGSSSREKLDELVASLDLLIWRQPEGGGVGNDHPYVRDACLLEAVRKAMTDAIAGLPAVAKSKPDTRVLPGIERPVPAQPPLVHTALVNTSSVETPITRLIDLSGNTASAQRASDVVVNPRFLVLGRGEATDKLKP